MSSARHELRFPGGGPINPTSTLLGDGGPHESRKSWLRALATRDGGSRAASIPGDGDAIRSDGSSQRDHADPRTTTGPQSNSALVTASTVPIANTRLDISNFRKEK